MQNEINTITQEFFHKDNADGVAEQDLDHFISKYPYVAPARFLLAKKKYADSGEPIADVITAGLYFNNPLWLSCQLEKEENEQVTIIENPPAVQPKVEDESPIAFQSYHTIDYFASQGIRLQQAELSRDRLGQQLKSFTEWLRSMKKLPSAEGQPASPEDDTRQQLVIQNAASSLQEKEVFTEAMAEVWLKQGNNAKASEIYYKLSLLNPSKSSYFAAKIDQLK
ncbi:MAG TPA: hypothetical protein VM101_06680 [Flavitalea sp.]|nr:hypothetical protein [Flavitalea sp.]